MNVVGFIATGHAAFHGFSDMIFETYLKKLQMIVPLSTIVGFIMDKAMV
jgi:hypothetical protein